MALHGRYSSNVLRGVIGKMDKQVYKLAAILHAAENYGDGVKSRTISKETAIKAHTIYMKLTQIYMDTSDEKGFFGIKSQTNAVVKYLQSYTNGGRLNIKVRTLVDNVKKTRPWKDQKNRTVHFKAMILPELFRRKICDYSDDEAKVLMINPKIK